MFENIAKFFKKLVKSENKESQSKDTAKERLHLVLMQDRANVSADFMELMKQEIIEVIKKYIDVEESAIDVRLTNEITEDGTTGAPSLYANIPIKNIKNNFKKIEKDSEVENKNNSKEEINEETQNNKEEDIKDSVEENINVNNENITKIDEQQDSNNLENEPELNNVEKDELNEEQNEQAPMEEPKSDEQPESNDVGARN